MTPIISGTLWILPLTFAAGTLAVVIVIIIIVTMVIVIIIVTIVIIMTIIVIIITMVVAIIVVAVTIVIIIILDDRTTALVFGREPVLGSFEISTFVGILDDSDDFGRVERIIDVVVR